MKNNSLAGNDLPKISKRWNMKKALYFLGFSMALGSSCWASEQTFSFNLPSFGGNPLNTSHYLALLDSQKQLVIDEEENVSTVERFTEDLERRLLSSLASDIVNQIFGIDSEDNGQFQVGNMDVTYNTVNDDLIITITDGLTTTEVVVPNID